MVRQLTPSLPSTEHVVFTTTYKTSRPWKSTWLQLPCWLGGRAYTSKLADTHSFTTYKEARKWT